MKVVVTGATGYIGVPLVTALRARGREVIVLTRDPVRARAALGEGVRCVEASLDTPTPAWTFVLAGADAIVHLAGESVASKRWDARQKQAIRDSRVESTRGLVEALGSITPEERPKTLVVASGVDYYPWAAEPLDDDEVSEADPAGDTFLGRVCRDWEAEARAAQPLGLRVCALRTGLVIGPGGPLAEMARPFKLFAGGRIGNGRQWVSWISLDDIVKLYLTAIDDPRYDGPINAVAPEAVRAADVARALGRALHRPSWLPAPGFALRLALGEFAEVLLHGRRVVPTALDRLGFRWEHAHLADALATAV